jgi:GT2 family glycosyltransferase
MQCPAKISVVIVNYRTGALAIECLRSLATETASLPNLRVIVVDNASGDGSLEIMRKQIATRGWEQWASILPLERNGGFAFGSNAGIRAAMQARPIDYLMLLNPDAAIYQRAISLLANFMEAHPQVGVAGSRLENELGEVQCSAHNSPSPLGELEAGARFSVLTGFLGRYAVSGPVREVAHECDWVSGAGMMIRRTVVEQVGLLDENYFLYFDEVDFCLRARKAGWTVWFVPESRVLHVEGASTGIKSAAQRRPAYWYDSRRRFFVKHFGVFGLLAADVMWTAGRASLAARRLLRLGEGGRQQDPKWHTYDLIRGDLQALLRGTLRGREDLPS